MKTYLLFFGLLFSSLLFSQTVYSTPSGTKYHTSTCRSVKNVAHPMSVSTAQQRGLSACKICKPSSASSQNSSSYKGQPLGIKPGEAKGASDKAVQCKGKTQKGLRCKRTTKNKNGYCHQHEP